MELQILYLTRTKSDELLLHGIGVAVATIDKYSLCFMQYASQVVLVGVPNYMQVLLRKIV